jgi:hypothetical protein
LRVAFIDLAVAVVVEPVAFFIVWLEFWIALERGIVARGQAVLADPQEPCVACLAAARIAVVIGAIAIVVEPVANLSDGLFGLDTLQAPVLALLGPFLALTDVIGDSAHPTAAWVAFVGCTIAIVIETVAGLRRC